MNQTTISTTAYAKCILDENYYYKYTPVRIRDPITKLLLCYEAVQRRRYQLTKTYKSILLKNIDPMTHHMRDIYFHPEVNSIFILLSKYKQENSPPHLLFALRTILNREIRIFLRSFNDFTTPKK